MDLIVIGLQESTYVERYPCRLSMPNTIIIANKSHILITYCMNHIVITPKAGFTLLRVSSMTALWRYLKYTFAPSSSCLCADFFFFLDDVNQLVQVLGNDWTRVQSAKRAQMQLIMLCRKAIRPRIT